MAAANPQVDGGRLGKRRCRWCGKPYRWPIGSVAAGCPSCAPQLDGLGSSPPTLLELGTQAAEPVERPDARYDPATSNIPF